MSPVRVAVVGAGGQVGPKILERMSRDPRVSAWGVCRNRVSAGPLLMDGLDVRCGSITDRSALPGLVGDADVVINCAAAGGLPGSARRNDSQVIRALSGPGAPGRLIYLSSVAVYGSCIDPGSTTFAHPSPDWVDGRQKLYLERLVSASAPRTSEVTVLRLGHVYGAGQWLSRFILDGATKASCPLPYGGALPSNAVHVSNVAAAALKLVTDGIGGGTYNVFDPGNSTWRQVSEWNTRCAGVAPAGSLCDGESDLCASHYRGLASASLVLRLLREVRTWATSLPSSLVASCPTARQIGLHGLGVLQSEWLERIIQRRYLAGLARDAHRRLLVDQPWLLSAAAPGPMLEFDSDVSENDGAALKAWWRLLANPDAVLEWDPVDAELRAMSAATGPDALEEGGTETR